MNLQKLNPNIFIAIKVKVLTEISLYMMIFVIVFFTANLLTICNLCNFFHL